MTTKLRPAFWILGILLFLALGRDFLANGRPLYCRIGGESFWPGLRTVWADKNVPFGHPLLDSIRVTNLWRAFPYESAVFAPIPFSPGEIASPVAGRARPGAAHPELPGAFRHWLGTDDRGRDVAAGLVSGARIAALTGVTAMVMAMGIGLLLGALAGFWGDDRLRVQRGQLWFTLLGLPVAWFYAFTARQYALQEAETLAEWGVSTLVFFGIILFFNGLSRLLGWFFFFSKAITVPADLLIMRLAEVFNSIPKLIFVIAIAALMPQGQSIWLMIALIGAMSWTGVARFVRADLLRVRELDFVTAARGLGLPETRILLRHALPNALRSTLIAFAFGVAGAVLLEAALSFLGFGGDEFRGKSWGSLLNSARSYPTDWWVALPPGLAICVTVLALNAIGEALSEGKKS